MAVLALGLTLPQLSRAEVGSNKLLNPDISVDGLFAGSFFNQDDPLTFNGGHDPHKNGFNIQQVELSLNANIDPYFRGDVNLVLTPEGIEIEEAYATSLDLPANLQLKAGQFLNAFGRNNPTHPHTWDFVNKPLVLGRFFGGDGLRAPGVQLSWLAPLPWYSEITGSIQNSDEETAPSFNKSGKMRGAGDGIFLARWSHFFSLGETLSLNLGTSYLNGKNTQSLSAERTQVLGGDVYLKFRETSSLSFLSLQAEVLKRYYGRADADPVSGAVVETRPSDWGGYLQLNYRLPDGWDRWHVGLRYDLVGDKGDVPVATSTTVDATGATVDRDLARRFRVSPVVTFYPSEFSKVRLQYDYDKPSDWVNAQQVVTLQLEFLMGAHGAHKF
jgi:hypothetical protein